MKTTKYLLGIAALFQAASAFSQLEVGGDLLDSCGEIEALANAGQYREARDKARVCLDALEEELSGEVSQYFLPEVGDWTRTSLEQNQVLGLNNIMAEYQKGDIEVQVSLVGQSGGAGGVAGLGGLFGGIAQSAIAQSGRQVTVAGLPSSVQPDGTIMVPLSDGSMLTFSSGDLETADDALAGMGDLVNDFPVADINEALQ